MKTLQADSSKLYRRSEAAITSVLRPFRFGVGVYSVFILLVYLTGNLKELLFGSADLAALLTAFLLLNGLAFLFFFEKDLRVGFGVTSEGLICPKCYIVNWASINTVESGIHKQTNIHFLWVDTPSFWDLRTQKAGKFPAKWKGRVPFPWPLEAEDIADFKAAVLKYAPEGNPLREYVEKNL